MHLKNCRLHIHVHKIYILHFCNTSLKYAIFLIQFKDSHAIIWLLAVRNIKNIITLLTLTRMQFYIV